MFQTCRVCGMAVRRYRTEAKNSQGSAVFTDERGRTWNGKQCPACRYADVLKCKERQRLSGIKSVKRIKELLGQNTPLFKPQTVRNCRVCGGVLPRERYFRHKECDVKVDYLDLGDIYGQTRRV